MAILVVAIVSLSFFAFIYVDFLNSLDTAFIASRGGWMSCDDSSVRPVDPKQVVVSFFNALNETPHNFDSITNRAKRPMFYFTNVFDFRFQLAYFIFFQTHSPSPPIYPAPPCCSCFIICIFRPPHCSWSEHSGYVLYS